MDDYIDEVRWRILVVLSDGPLMTTELQRKGRFGGTTWYLHKPWFEQHGLIRIYPERKGKARTMMIKLTKKGERIAGMLKEIEKLLKVELII